tara:strand:- start:272 stop:610 length:339 start_codon:yes stop_codon:yes gene_type:complete
MKLTEPSFITALHALVPEVKEKNIPVVFDAMGTVTYWENYDHEPPSQKEILAELKRQVVEYDYFKYYRDRKNNLPDPYDLLWILYQDIKNDDVKNGAFVSLLDKVVEKYPEP